MIYQRYRALSLLGVYKPVTNTLYIYIYIYIVHGNHSKITKIDSTNEIINLLFLNFTHNGNI